MNYIKNYSITFNASSLEFQSTPSVGRATSPKRAFLILLNNFNPRPPWGGRLLLFLFMNLYTHFNPRPPWGGRRVSAVIYRIINGISIHALRGEGDPEQLEAALHQIDFNPRPPWGGRRGAETACENLRQFQSTPSVGRATVRIDRLRFENKISIHALRGEGDKLRRDRQSKQSNFNPRPPWGGRRAEWICWIKQKPFQSTPSVGRATDRQG